ERRPRVGFLQLRVVPVDPEIMPRLVLACSFHTAFGISEIDVKSTVIFIIDPVACLYRCFPGTFRIKCTPQLTVPIIIKSKIPANITHEEPPVEFFPECREQET